MTTLIDQATEQAAQRDLTRRWWDHAACKGMDTGIFFPAEHDFSAAMEAKAICRSCPVNQQCLDDICRQVYGATNGIFGGMSPKQRVKYRAKLKVRQS